MQGVSIVETATLVALINKVENLEGMVSSTLNQLKDKSKPYLSTAEVMLLTGFSKNWVLLNKDKIGFSKLGKDLIFKRSDVADYIEQNYFKIKTKRS